MASIIYYDAMGRGADMSDMDLMMDVYDGPVAILDDIWIESWDWNTDVVNASYDGGSLFVMAYVAEISYPIYLLEDMYAFDIFGQSLADFEGINLRFNINDDFSNGVSVTNALGTNDYVEGNNYSDYLSGFAGSDRLVGLGGSDTLDGGLGADTMYGGIGNDVYLVNNTGDRVFEASFSGVDTILSSVSCVLPSYVEELGLTGTRSVNGAGNYFANLLVGNSGNNVLSGKGGNDGLAGGAGSDRLVGGAGRDTLAGGIGRDVFDFDKAAESGATVGSRDVITDFVRGVDRIDLSTIDANTANGSRTNDAFRAFIGGSVAFTRPGQLKFVGGVLYANTDNDRAAEISIQVSGVSALNTTDLVM